MIPTDHGFIVDGNDVSVRLPLAPLTPAALAAGLGAGAHLLGADPTVSIGAAVIGAAVGAIGWRAEEAAPAAPARPAPEIETGEPAIPLEAVLDVMPMAMMIVAPDRTIRLANDDARALFALGDGADDSVAVLRARRLIEKIDQALAGEPEASVAFQHSRGTERYLNAHLRRIAGSDDILVAIADETQMHSALATHRDFIANASHELKTPLAAVSGIIETLVGPARNDPQATDRFLKMLAAQSVRMTRLVEDLLSLNRVELNERVAPDVPEELTRAVAESVDALRPMAEMAGVDLVFEHVREGVIVHADRDELDQLFQNLIENAIKYGGRDTTVTVTLRQDAPPGPDVIGISVKDQGPGIARADLPRLTERFYRANTKHARDRAGTGLGLAICELIVNRHRGRLEIASRLGHGAEFTVWLPVVRRLRKGEPVISETGAPELASSARAPIS